MTKQTLAEQLAFKHTIPVYVAEKIVNEFFNILSEKIIEGCRIEIRHFGNFTVRKYKSYMARNPLTGENFITNEKRLPFWRTGKALQERINKL